MIYIYISDIRLPEIQHKADHPTSCDIYISTKTKIAYLSQTIDLKGIFWCIPVTEYAKPCDCVIKKQMKFNSNDLSELNEIKDNLKNETHYEEYVITHIDNPSGRIKFKDITTTYCIGK